MASPEEQTSTILSGEFVLLATFDGIRGCSIALRSLGIEPIADYSSEVEENCQRLIALKFPRCTQLGDVRKIDRQVLEKMVHLHGTGRPWLVVGGSSCQDLSCRRGPNAKGLAGKKSKLFFEFGRILNILMDLGVQVAFLLENVASMPDTERDTITEYLGVDPLEIDSALVSGCHRLRYYWTNLPTTPLQSLKVDIDSLLDDGWHRVPEGKPFRCFTSSAAFQAQRGRGEVNGVRRATDGAERIPNADEREAILGFPRGHTRLLNEDGEEVFPETLRMKMLGNSFSVQVVAHLLAEMVKCTKHGGVLELKPLHEGARVAAMNRICREDEEEDPTVDTWNDIFDEGGCDEAALPL